MTENQHIQAIKPKVTPEFIDTLVELARIFGWSSDYIEVMSFVRFCSNITGRTLTPEDLEEYQHDD